MSQILIEDSGNVKLPKNVKSVNSTMLSHIASCHVIPRSATMKGWEKGEFWKTNRVWNLKRNKSNNLKSS